MNMYTGPRWVERALDSLDEQLERGDITDKEYRDEMRSIGEDIADGADRAADEARENYYGGF